MLCEESVAFEVDDAAGAAFSDGIRGTVTVVAA